jgi:hypothetical protein
MVHLAGGWRHFGNLYKNAKLLYRCGSYLTAHEEALLDSVAASARFR